MLCCRGTTVPPAHGRDEETKAPDAAPTKLKSHRTAPGDDDVSDVSDDIEEAQSFSESLLDISLRKDRELVLVASSVPDMARDSAAIALNYKGITYLEEQVAEGDLPYHLREVGLNRSTRTPHIGAVIRPHAVCGWCPYWQAFEGSKPPFLAWKSAGVYSASCRPDVRGAFKFIEVCSRDASDGVLALAPCSGVDLSFGACVRGYYGQDHVAFPRLFLPSCLYGG